MQLNDTSAEAYPAEPEGWTLSDVLQVMRKRARVIAGATCVAGLLALLIALVMPSRYQSTATVLIDPRHTKVVDIDEVVSGISPDSPTVDSEVEMVSSLTVVGRVVDELNLASDPEFAQRGLMKKLLSFVTWSDEDDEASLFPPLSADQATASAVSDDRIIAAVLSRLTVRRVRLTYLISISFESHDAAKAARIANALAKAYVQEQVDAKLRAAEQATSWLERRVGELRERVFDTERLVEEYKSQNLLVDAGGQPLDEKELSRTMEQLSAAQSETAEVKAKFERAKSLVSSDKDVGTIDDAIANLNITNLKDALAKASRQAVELRTKYGPKHPVMLKAEAEAREARQQLHAEVQKVVANLETGYEVARNREVTLQARVERQKSLSGSNGQALIRLRELEREATANRSVYEAFLKRVQETQQQQNLNLADARITQVAVAVAEPSSPKRPQIAAIGLALGFLLSLATSVLYEFIYPSFVRPEKVEAALRLRHLASIELGGLSQGTGAASDPVQNLRRILIAPRSAFAEAIRTIRVAIDAGRPEDVSQVVLVASALPGEGKTVVASNLAHHYALQGAKTLLIDADLRKPALTRKFMPSASLGLADALADNLPADELIVRETRTNLHFLPARGKESRKGAAAELLSSGSMRELLQDLRGNYDVIVVDCPPAMVVVDARILAALADQVVFVCKWHQTSTAVARRAIQLLSAGGARFAGVVVNGADEIQSGSYFDRPSEPAPARRRAA